MLMSQYIASLKRLRQEYLREDAQTEFSDKAFAQRLLSRAGLTKKARMDCFFSAGGKYKAKDIERLLRFRSAKVHEEESRRPAAPRANEESSASRSSGYKRSNRSGRYQYRGSTRYGRQVYHADDSQAFDDDDQETGDADDEDLEEEMASGRINDEDDYQDSWQDDYGGYGQDSYWQADGDWCDQGQDLATSLMPVRLPLLPGHRQEHSVVRLRMQLLVLSNQVHSLCVCPAGNV